MISAIEKEARREFEALRQGTTVLTREEGDGRREYTDPVVQAEWRGFVQAYRMMGVLREIQRDRVKQAGEEIRRLFAALEVP